MTVTSYASMTLVPTATAKTSAYTAAVNDLVIADATSSDVPITLPANPADKSTVGVLRQDATFSTHAVTVARGGTNAFYGGSTTAISMPIQGALVIFQFVSAVGQWIVRWEPPLSQLDSRYQPPVWAPSDYNFISWNFDPVKATGSTTALTAGQQNLVLLPIRQVATVTNVLFDIATAGSGLTTGQCFAGLFNSSGTLLSATADQSTGWQAAGLKTMALVTPQLVLPGLYYVGFFANGTTLPKIFYDPNAFAAVGLSSPLFTHPRFVIDTTNTGLTTAFHSPATLTNAPNNPYYWVGAS